MYLDELIFVPNVKLTNTTAWNKKNSQIICIRAGLGPCIGGKNGLAQCITSFFAFHHKTILESGKYLSAWCSYIDEQQQNHFGIDFTI